ncbi:anthrone oxygenase family protein [Brachybacterium sp. FME24]|uniref:anthrone oxygenase family protein n=1 Tax=Brachybacterium sp. FME24 TaxID=2742605 RepID=UPI0018664501|nr:anthrone oxygenase family protein [Brachybacterium sp. FME24]
MPSVLAVIATTSTGLLVGVELAVAVVLNPILRGLPFAAAIAGRAHGGRMLGRAMPFWYIGSTILLATLTALTWGTSSAGAALLAAALLLVGVVLSVVLLVPINKQTITWTAESHPGNWQELQQRWDRLHIVRVALLVVAFVLVVVATTLL